MRNHEEYRERSSTAGFALPVAIFALVVVGVLVSGGFFVAQQESRISQAEQQGTRAFYLAEQGIGEVVENWDNEHFTQLPLFRSDFVAGNAEGGEWEVEVRRIGVQLFFLGARGTITQGGQYAGANREIGMVMRIRSVEIDVPAAITTQGDLNMSGNARINGADQMPPGWGGSCSVWAENKPGALTTPGSEVNESGNSEIQGSPAWDNDPSIDDDTFTEFGGLSWDELIGFADIVHSGGVVLDQMGPRYDPPGDPSGACDKSHLLNWGDPEDPSRPCWSYFPTIYVDGDLTTAGGGMGQGLLLVEGNLHMEGGFNFHGIIIAQGAVTMSGGGSNAPIVRGGILSKDQGDGHDGASRVEYSSCAIQRALAGLNNSLVELRPIERRTWADLTSLPFL